MPTGALNYPNSPPLNNYHADVLGLMHGYRMWVMWVRGVTYSYTPRYPHFLPLLAN